MSYLIDSYGRLDFPGYCVKTGGSIGSGSCYCMLSTKFPKDVVILVIRDFDGSLTDISLIPSVPSESFLVESNQFFFNMS